MDCEEETGLSFRSKNIEAGRFENEVCEEDISWSTLLHIADLWLTLGRGT